MLQSRIKRSRTNFADRIIGYIAVIRLPLAVAEYKYKNLRKEIILTLINATSCFFRIITASYWKSFVHTVSVLLAIGVAVLQDEEF